ncbi:MAG: VWA domain-containing protein [Microthrixaceae bacterium]
MSEQREDGAMHLQPIAASRLPAPSMPFAAIAGQAELKLALLLAGVQPYLGGVLVTGRPGTTPAATARAFATVLPDGAPFVEVPRSADVDRLVGTALRADGSPAPGLLRQVDGGVLFLDGIDRFPNKIVEVVLDAHNLGYTSVERGGTSVSYPSRFVLVATTDGPLPPRWATHFGLSVDATGLHQADHRVEATRRQLNFEHDPTSFAAKWATKQRDLRRRLDLARPAEVPTQLLTPIGWLTAEIGVVNIAADLALARGAAALAGWEGRRMATESDLAAVAPMVLRHQPVGDRPNGPDGAVLEAAIGRFTSSAARPIDRIDVGDAPSTPDAVATQRETSTPPAPSPGDSPGREAEATPEPEPSPAEFTDVITRSAADLAAEEPEEAGGRVPWVTDTRLDLGGPVRGRPLTFEAGRQATDLVVLSVDASGSRDSESRVLAASGALLRTLAASPDHAIEVSLVTYGGDGAEVVLGPTSSIEVARSKLVEVTVGGGSPLAAGLQSALSVATLHSAGRKHGRSLLVLVTDGRANVPCPPSPPARCLCPPTMPRRPRPPPTPRRRRRTGPNRRRPLRPTPSPSTLGPPTLSPELRGPPAPRSTRTPGRRRWPMPRWWPTGWHAAASRAC